MISVEIVCESCGEETLLRREPVYEGLKKVGEKLFCTSCGHEYADEESISFKERKNPKVFDEDDAPKKLDIFNDDEREKNCRHCEHYVVNPFKQRCGLHEKEVQATDLCFDFVKKEDQVEEEDEEESS